MSMYSCEISVGDIKEMQLEKKKERKNGEKTFLMNINKLCRILRLSPYQSLRNLTV